MGDRSQGAADEFPDLPISLRLGDRDRDAAPYRGVGAPSGGSPGRSSCRRTTAREHSRLGRGPTDPQPTPFSALSLPAGEGGLSPDDLSHLTRTAHTRHNLDGRRSSLPDVPPKLRCHDGTQIERPPHYLYPISLGSKNQQRARWNE